MLGFFETVVRANFRLVWMTEERLERRRQLVPADREWGMEQGCLQHEDVRRRRQGVLVGSQRWWSWCARGLVEILEE
jgi:hypothetical protein